MDQEPATGESKDRALIVIVVARNPDKLDRISKILAGFGRLVLVENGEQALEAIAGLNLPDDLAILLSCQKLDNMDGLSFLRQSLSFVPRAMRLLYSEEADPDVLIQAINRARIHQFIRPDTDLNTLEKAISRFMIGWQQFKRQNVYLRQLEQKVEEQTRFLEERNRELEEVNLTDSLTGLRNRRYLLKYLNADIARVRRDYMDWISDRAPSPPAASDIVFFMLKLDRLDEVYDTYGQAAGNGVLILLRQLLGGIFREYDYLVRWSRDNFLVVARFIRRADAGMLAQRICDSINSHEFMSVEGDPLPQTCSVGFACYPFLAARPDQITWSHILDLSCHFMAAAAFGGGNNWLTLDAADSADEDLSFQAIITGTSDLIQNGKLKVQSSIEEEGGWSGKIEFPLRTTNSHS